MKLGRLLIGIIMLFSLGGTSASAENTKTSGSNEVMVINETKDSNTKLEEVSPVESNQELVTEVGEIDKAIKKNESQPDNLQNMLPKYLHGEWQGDGNLKSIFLTENTYTVNGTEYRIKYFIVENNVYTLIWDEEAYIQMYGKPDIWNPQPFIFTYDVNKDVIDITGNLFFRKSMNTVDEKDKYEKFSENEDVPVFLQDKWVATVNDETIVWTITPRAIDVNGVLTYKVIAYGTIGNQYTIIWDNQAYIDQYGKPGNFNPQPFIFDYDKSTDTLVTIDGTIFRREDKGIGTTDSKKEEVKTTPSTDSKGKLPQTGENLSSQLALLGSGLFALSGYVLLRKFRN